jgi:galactose-1-phosphate uridylyltransferase
MIDLVSVTEQTARVDPGGNRWEQTIEHRIDPLTGTVASLNAALGEKAKAFIGTADLDLVRALEERSAKVCPFCSAAEKGTRFLPELVAEGQLRVGSALCIPNLFAKAGFDSVVIVDAGRHALLASKIPARAFGDAVRAAAELLRRARRTDPALVHHVAGMNFLPPGGSSVPHPHFQVHVRSVPYSGIAATSRLAAAYRERTGRSYFEDLLAKERGGPRHVGTTGAVEWIAAWAPSHQKEIWGVLPGTASLADVSDEVASALGGGISRVVSFYEESGTNAFTLAFLSSPDPGARGTWALHVKLCSRPAFRAEYTNYDTWFAPLFAGDEAHTEKPEVYAERLRARW